MSDRVQQRKDERECDSCHYPAKNLTEYIRRDEKKTLCELCASTDAGSVLDYPRNYDAQVAPILRTLCFIGNLILDTLTREADKRMAPDATLEKVRQC